MSTGGSLTSPCADRACQQALADLSFEPAARERLIGLADGDARRLLNLLEQVRTAARTAGLAAVDGEFIEKAMAQSLRIRVIAEGVETKEQLQFLRDHECDECQGFYLSRPLPAGELALLARAWGRDQNMQRFAPPVLVPNAISA